MSSAHGLWRRLARGRTVDLWYDPAYRLPLSSLEGTGMEPRRADWVTWYLNEIGAVEKEQVHAVRPISYRKLSRVHDEQYLESLARPETLAAIYSVDPSDVVVDEMLQTLRLGCGGTLAAARFSLATSQPAMNLLGGFHHARPNGGGGFCAVNDIAVAVASLRAKGVTGRIAILDLDAHPPDGTAECLKHDPAVWIGSLSGSDWGPLPPLVDETVLPDRAPDGVYLDALDALLDRMPTCQLAFVIAGGDVLDGDRFGRLGLTIRGARERDVRVNDRLLSTPTVWLPGGGYHQDSWRVLAGTGLVLARRPRKRIPRRYDPLHARFLAISRALPVATLSSDSDELSADDIDGLFGAPAARQTRFVGFYTAQGLEHALFRFGFFDQVRRLGYHDLRVATDTTGSGDRLRLFGKDETKEHLLVEVVAERRRIGEAEFLFINWLSLRNPRARFSTLRPQLPGQEYPGLGLAREVSELLALMARRLELAGVAFRPAWYHVAYTARSRFLFVDGRRQGRFEAMVRDLKGRTLLDATRAVADKRVRLDGVPYEWEATDMVFWLDPAAAKTPEYLAEVEAERERVRFTVDEPAAEQAG